MATPQFRTVLVIGENHKDIIKKYSQDTKLEERVLVCKFDDAEKLHQQKIESLKHLISSSNDFTAEQIELWNAMLEDYQEMDSFEYYRELTDGCWYDEDGNAWTDVNPNAYYKYEKCNQALLEKYGEEGSFSNPFKLKDGGIAYVAKVKDIDWHKMHMYNTDMYRRAWEMVVDGSEATNDVEERIKFSMENRKEYFNNFESVDDYVRHSCSFWTYGVATKDNYDELGNFVSDKEWVATFYDKYIKPLDGDETLAIYEVRSID